MLLLILLISAHYLLHIFLSTDAVGSAAGAAIADTALFLSLFLLISIHNQLFIIINAAVARTEFFMLLLVLTPNPLVIFLSLLWLLVLNFSCYFFPPQMETQSAFYCGYCA
jgi:hypothetical protein